MDKILEFVGFEYDTTQTKGYVHDMGWKDSDGHFLIGKNPNGPFWEYTPPLDMDFFFKYVVPKLQFVEMTKLHDKSFAFNLGIVASGKLSGWIKDNDLNKAWQEALLKLLE